MSMTAPDRIYLVMAAVGSDPVCAKVHNAIMSGFVFVPSGPSVLIQSLCTCDDHSEKKNIIMALGTANLGISDFSYDETG